MEIYKNSVFSDEKNSIKQFILDKLALLKKKFLPVLTILFLFSALGVTLSQVQQKQENRGRAEFNALPLRVPTKLFGGTLPTETFNGGNVYASEVHYENGIYKMWYGGQKESDAKDRIHYAESPDGITWTKKGVVLDVTSQNNIPASFHVNDPSIVKLNGIYYMFYTDYSTQTGDKISLATSTDGISWTKQKILIVTDPNAIWHNQGGPARPSVIYENGMFKMWFDSSCRPLPNSAYCDPAQQYPAIRYVSYTTSSNGYDWATPVLAKTNFGSYYNAGAVDVKKYHDTYIMVSEGLEGTYFGSSKDGINWIYHGIFIPKSGTSFDTATHTTPMLFISPLEGKPTAVYMAGGLQTNFNKNSVGMARLAGNELDSYVNMPPKGSFDVKNCSYLRGWACDKDAGGYVTVQLYADGLKNGSGRLIGSAVANLNRRNDPDYTSVPNHLQVEDTISNQECGGQQETGWKFTVPDSIKDGQPHTLYAYGVNVPVGADPLFTYYYPDGTTGVNPPTYASTTPYTLTCAAPPPTNTPIPTSTPVPPTPTNTPTPSATPTRTPTPSNTPTSTPTPTPTLAPQGNLTASPNPCTITSGTTCNTTISWSSSNVNNITLILDSSTRLLDASQQLSGTIPVQIALGNHPLTLFANGGTIVLKTITLTANPSPTSTPTPTRTPTPTFTPTPTRTPTPLIPSATNTPIPNSPTPTPTLAGNIVAPHNVVDLFDYNAIVTDFGLTGTNLRADIVPNNAVDLFDYNKVVSNFGNTLP